MLDGCLMARKSPVKVKMNFIALCQLYAGTQILRVLHNIVCSYIDLYNLIQYNSSFHNPLKQVIFLNFLSLRLYSPGYAAVNR